MTDREFNLRYGMLSSKDFAIKNVGVAIQAPDQINEHKTLIGIVCGYGIDPILYIETCDGTGYDPSSIALSKTYLYTPKVVRPVSIRSIMFLSPELFLEKYRGRYGKTTFSGKGEIIDIIGKRIELKGENSYAFAEPHEISILPKDGGNIIIPTDVSTRSSYVDDRVEITKREQR
jgi:hypothetical protein